MQELAEAIREEGKRLLESGEVDLVIGFTVGTLPLRAAPVFVRRAEDAERLVWNSFCENNLARYLRDIRDKRVAVVAKGCDTRAIVALLNEHQLDRDKLHIIGVPCHGMVDRRIVARRAPAKVLAVREEGEEIVAEGESFSIRLPRSQVLYRSCAACTHPNPVIYDILLGEEVAVWAEDPYAHVREIEQKPAAERASYFATEAQRCIRCYACRQACPMCYCERCIVEKTMPLWIPPGIDARGNFAWNQVRAMHLAGRCISCGECERVCPMGIPLMLLNRKIERVVNEQFDYVAGQDAQVEPVMGRFRLDDEEDFIR